MTEKPNIIVDLDGTLAILDHRLHFVSGQKKDWESFFKACVNDSPNQDVIDLVSRIVRSASDASPIEVHIFSGRNEIVRQETLEWLGRYVSFDFSLLMRPEKDHRPDALLKKDFLEMSGLTPENTLCVLDDRKSVVDMWRAEGFTCLQVADRDF